MDMTGSGTAMGSMPGMTTGARADDVVPASIVPWLVMVTAMMAPAALPTVRRLALTSLWRRRQRTVALFVGGYLAVWTAFGVLALTLASLAEATTRARPTALTATLLVAAAVWQLTTWKRRSVRARHLLAPLPQHGIHADAASAAAGVRHALWCVVGCWPVMLAMAFADIRLAVVAVLTLVIAGESVARRSDRLTALAAAATLAAALAVAAA